MGLSQEVLKNECNATSVLLDMHTTLIGRGIHCDPRTACHFHDDICFECIFHYFNIEARIAIRYHEIEESLLGDIRRLEYKLRGFESDKRAQKRKEFREAELKIELEEVKI